MFFLCRKTWNKQLLQHVSTKPTYTTASVYIVWTTHHCVSLTLIPGALINPSYFWHVESKHVGTGRVRRVVGNNTSCVSTLGHLFRCLVQWLTTIKKKGVYTGGGRQHVEAIIAPFQCVIWHSRYEMTCTFGHMPGIKKPSPITL